MTQWIEWDKKSHYASEILSNGTPVNLLFYCHIILYREKVTSYEKFSHNLTLDVQIFLKKCRLFNAKYRNGENCWISKNFILRGPKQQSLKLFSPPQPPPLDKTFLRLFVRSYTVICRHLPSKCLNNAVLGRLEMV